MELEKEDLRDRQENEVEALKAIFADDFEDIRENEVGKIVQQLDVIGHFV